MYLSFIKYQYIVLATLFAFLLIGITSTTFAEERNQVNVETDTERTTELRAVDHNSSRSNVRSAPDGTNVCDGVTCPDGSCAATRDECPVTATISPDIYANDRDERERDAVTNPQEPEPTAEHVEVEQRLAPDRVDVEVQNTPPATERATPSQVPDRAQSESGQPATFRDVDSDNDGILDLDEDGIRPAQDYNSSRSNRIKSNFFDPDEGDEIDGDVDGVVTVRRDRISALRDRVPEIRCGAELSARDDGGSLWCWGHGVRAAATGEEDADGTVSTSTRVLQYLSVRGDDVRSWNEEERAQFREYSERVAEVGTPERLTAEITNLVLTNERIADMTITESETVVRYRAQMRLFGFIPMEREVTARGTDVDDLSISYPWYSFLARTPDTDTIRGLFDSLSTTIASGSGGGAGKATFRDFTLSTD